MYEITLTSKYCGIIVKSSGEYILKYDLIKLVIKLNTYYYI